MRLLAVQNRRLMFHRVRYQLLEQVDEMETNGKQKLHLELEQSNVRNSAIRKQTSNRLVFLPIKSNKNLLQKVENKFLFVHHEHLLGIDVD